MYAIRSYYDTDITPHAHLFNTDICVGSAGWADAGVSLPWQIYENYGNIRILKEHYNSAKKWVDFVHLHNPDLLWTEKCGSNWGDWLVRCGIRKQTRPSDAMY